jgi:hypothetical protein
VRAGWWLALLSVFALVLAVGACGDGSAGDETTPTATATSTSMAVPTSTADADGLITLEGIYETGFEHSGFTPDAECSTNGEAYWLSWTDEFDFGAALEDATGVAPFSGAEPVMFRVTVRGELSEPGEYGHLGQYPRELVVHELLLAAHIEHCGNGVPADSSPPPVTASVGSAAQELGLGTYCWTSASGPGICADAIGIISNDVPLPVAAGSTVTLRSSLDLAALDVGAQRHAVGQPIASGPGWSAWPSTPAGDVPLATVADGLSFTVDFSPGEHLIAVSVFAPQGDAHYGLLIEVEGATGGGATLPLDEPTALVLGVPAAIEGGAATIELTAVSDDSRCPTDVTCVWAGEATLSFAATSLGGTQANFDVTYSPGTEAVHTFGGYTLTVIELGPEPVSTSTIEQSEYVATVIVSASP